MPSDFYPHKRTASIEPETPEGPPETCTCAECGRLLSKEKFPKGAPCPYCGSVRRLAKSGEAPHAKRVRPLVVLTTISLAALVAILAFLYIRVGQVTEDPVAQLARKFAQRAAERARQGGPSQDKQVEGTEEDAPLAAAPGEDSVVPVDETRESAPARPAGLVCRYARRVRLDELFQGGDLAQERWEAITQDSPADCILDFSLADDRLIGTAGAGAPGKETTLAAKNLLSGDFDIAMAYAWVGEPQQGEGGCYVSVRDADSGAEATLDVHAGVGGGSTRTVLFEYRETSSSAPPAVVRSAKAPASGRLRIVRTDNAIEAFCWNEKWESLGSTPAFTTPARFVMRLYAGSACAPFTIAFDDFTAVYALVTQHPARQTKGPEVEALTLIARKDGPILVIDEDGVERLSPDDLAFYNQPSSEQRAHAPRQEKEEPAPPRRATAQEEESQEPKRVLLPHFLTFLEQGRNELRFVNETTVPLDIGIRCRGRGRDLRLRPGARGPASVPDGEYDLYFVRSDAPDVLFRGERCILGGRDRYVEVRMREPHVEMPAGSGEGPP